MLVFFKITAIVLSLCIGLQSPARAESVSAENIRLVEELGVFFKKFGISKDLLVLKYHFQELNLCSSFDYSCANAELDLMIQRLEKDIFPKVDQILKSYLNETLKKTNLNKSALLIRSDLEIRAESLAASKSDRLAELRSKISDLDKAAVFRSYRLYSAKCAYINVLLSQLRSYYLLIQTANEINLF